MTWLLILAVCFLAYSNGANDNFKGVASLYGSKAASYRAAISWATVTTLAGSLSAIFLAESLMKRFSGKGLVPDALVASPSFVLAIALGAGLTVILATSIGFPVSTTHALLGAMVGEGWMAVGSQVRLGALGSSFLLPLLLSPVLAVLLGIVVYLAFRWGRLRLGIRKEWCICAGEVRQVIAMPQPGSVLAAQAAAPVLEATIAETAVCEQRYAGRVLGVNGQRLMDAAHFLSAGVVSFARGLNDTPKMAALLLILPALHAQWSLVMTSVVIAAGGWLSSRRVAMTMSQKITALNHGQGFSANLSTGALVIAASLFGLPVSTTHVSVGALTGIGLATRQARLDVLRNIVLSWIVTLPCAALLGALLYWIVR